MFPHAYTELLCLKVFGSTALIVACAENHLEVATVLIENGATVDYRDKVCNYIYCRLDLLDHRFVFTQKGMSALHIASELGHTDMVELLLKYQPQLEIRNKVCFVA